MQVAQPGAGGRVQLASLASAIDVRATAGEGNGASSPHKPKRPAGKGPAGGRRRGTRGGGKKPLPKLGPKPPSKKGSKLGKGKARSPNKRVLKPMGPAGGKEGEEEEKKEATPAPEPLDGVAGVVNVQEDYHSDSDSSEDPAAKHASASGMANKPPSLPAKVMPHALSQHSRSSTKSSQSLKQRGDEAAVGSAGRSLLVAGLSGSLSGGLAGNDAEEQESKQAPPQPSTEATPAAAEVVPVVPVVPVLSPVAAKALAAVSQAADSVQIAKPRLATIMTNNHTAGYPQDRASKLLTAAVIAVSEADSMVQMLGSVPPSEDPSYLRLVRMLSRMISELPARITYARDAVSRRSRQELEEAKAAVHPSQLERMCSVRQTSMRLAVAKKVLSRVRGVARVTHFLKQSPLAEHLKQASTLVIRAEVQADLVSSSPDAAITIAPKYATSVEQACSKLTACQEELCVMLPSYAPQPVEKQMSSATTPRAGEGDGDSGKVGEQEAAESPDNDDASTSDSDGQVRPIRGGASGSRKDLRDNSEAWDRASVSSDEPPRRSPRSPRGSPRAPSKKASEVRSPRGTHYDDGYSSDDSTGSYSSVASDGRGHPDDRGPLPRIHSLPGRPVGSGRMHAMPTESSEEFMPSARRGRRRRRRVRSHAQNTARSTRRQLRGVLSMMRNLLHRGDSSKEEGRDLAFQDHRREDRPRRHHRDRDHRDRDYSPRRHQASQASLRRLPSVSGRSSTRNSPRARSPESPRRGRDRGDRHGFMSYADDEYSHRRDGGGGGLPHIRSMGNMRRGDSGSRKPHKAKSSFNLFRKQRAPTPPSNFKRSRIP